MCRTGSIKILVAAVMCLVAVTTAAENNKPTADEVKALTLKASDVVRDAGIEQARAIFNKDGEFKHDEIYVNVIDGKGVWMIYPPKPEGVGKSMLNIQDADGKFLVQEILKLAAANGEGWIEYRWKNPVTNLLQLKETYVKQVSGTDFVVYIGRYK